MPDPKVLKKRINTKAKGSSRELECMKLFYRFGAKLVTKSSASLGASDLIACFPSKCIHVQVKSNNWPSMEEEYELCKLADSLNYSVDSGGVKTRRHHPLYEVICIVIKDQKKIKGKIVPKSYSFREYRYLSKQYVRDSLGKILFKKTIPIIYDLSMTTIQQYLDERGIVI